MTTPTRSHYHYHSFPRRWRDKSECDNKGVATLASIIESGLLLTPEQVHWPGEFKKGVRVSEGPISYHRRACFTYLLPDELNDHAKEFGPFSIEFDHWELRILGGIPVIYLPTESEYRGFLGVGIALASRLTDFQTLLERLQLLLEICEGVDAKSVDFICTPAPDGGILVGPNKAGAKMMHFRKELLQAIKAEKPAFEIPKLNGPTPFGGSTGSYA